MNKKLLIALVPILVVIIGLLGVLGFLLVEDGTTVYTEQMQVAQKFIDEGDYENAVLHFKKAIEADETQTDPYLLLAQIYYDNLGDIDNALMTLEQGYNNTGSEKIYQTLVSYRSAAGIEEPVEEVKGTAEKKGSLNTTLVDIFSTYTYKTYSEKMTIKNESKNSGMYKVSYAQYDIEFEYKNTQGENDVVDADTGLPYDYSRPTSIRIKDLGVLISGIEQGVSAQDLKENGISSVKQNKSNPTVGSEYLSFEYDECEFIIACDNNGIITKKDCYNSIVPPKGENTTTKVAVSGQIIDVTSGQKVTAETSLKFRKGVNNTTGSVEETVITSNGTYSVELLADTYTVEVSADDYTTEHFELVVPQTSSVEQDFSISPELAASQIRIVLEWGSTPHDLDSHLEGTSSGGSSVNVNFTNREVSGVANLDVDDTNGGGPETITIDDTRGSYVYKVHQFSSDGSLATSGATVKIYTGSSSQPIVVSVPSDVDSWWEVCTIENGRVVEINGVTN